MLQLLILCEAGQQDSWHKDCLSVTGVGALVGESTQLSIPSAGCTTSWQRKPLACRSAEFSPRYQKKQVLLVEAIKRCAVPSRPKFSSFVVFFGFSFF
jgi:hypothetical protein